MAWLIPPEAEGVVYEFFSPFVHVPGRYEACRIHSPTHGSFDCVIALGATTSDPADVYVRDDRGEGFMRERYPQSRVWRVGSSRLRLHASDDGRLVQAGLRALDGPIRSLELEFTAPPTALPTQASYGGEGRPIWGNPGLTCWGVDLNLEAHVSGEVVRADGRREPIDGPVGIVTVGSFGRIAPRRQEA